MINQRIAKIFYQMAEYYEMDNSVFKARAYEKAAWLVESMKGDLDGIYEEKGLKGLKELSGIGEGIAGKIEEFMKLGKINEYEMLKKKIPVDLEILMRIEGLGLKSIKALYEKLKIKNIDDLEKAAKTGKIAELEHFGEKSQSNIVRGIEFVKKSQGRFLLGYILPLARQMEKRIRNFEGVRKAVISGSIRRMKEIIGDIHILAIAENSEKIINFFCNMPEVENIISKSETCSVVKLLDGLNADLRILPKESFGAAWQYFTGSKNYNIALQEVAVKKGYKLSEYGLFDSEKQIAGQDEKEIYEKLELQFIEPEMRENTGEVELAAKKQLPEIIGYDEVIADLHMHTIFSDGSNTIQEMAQAAKKFGRQYIAITDHAGRLVIAGGMGEKEILRQIEEIEKVDQEISGIKILKGAEVDIDKNGILHIQDDVLAKLDIVIGSIHDNFKMPKDAMTERICRAMENSNLDILAHPSGRLLLKREGYELNWEKIFQQAVKTKTIIEINAFPNRLDLNWQNIKRAVAIGVKLSIGTDAHSIAHLPFLELGTAQARRGWAEAKDIVNTWSVEKLMDFLKNKY